MKPGLSEVLSENSGERLQKTSGLTRKGKPLKKLFSPGGNREPEDIPDRVTGTILREHRSVQRLCLCLCAVLGEEPAFEDRLAASLRS